MTLTVFKNIRVLFPEIKQISEIDFCYWCKRHRWKLIKFWYPLIFFIISFYLHPLAPFFLCLLYYPFPSTPEFLPFSFSLWLSTSFLFVFAESDPTTYSITSITTSTSKAPGIRSKILLCRTTSQILLSPIDTDTAVNKDAFREYGIEFSESKCHENVSDSKKKILHSKKLNCKNEREIKFIHSCLLLLFS